MAFGVGLGEGAKLMNDRLRIGVFIALAKHVGEEVRHRRHAERRTHVLKGVAPATTDAFRAVIIDAFW